MSDLFGPRNPPRKRRKVSQVVLEKRMRQIWIDGFGLIPQGATRENVLGIRIALGRLVADDAYWEGLCNLCDLRQSVDRLAQELKTANAKPKALKRRAGGKA